MEEKITEERIPKISKRKVYSGWCIAIFMAVFVSVAIMYTFKGKILRHDNSSSSPVPGSPGKVVQKYGDALKVAMQFFDVQKSGKLVDNKLSWRGDSALDDGKEAKLDLSKGMYDAGDHIKFGFPMAFTASILSWAIIEYGDQMQKVDQLKPAQDSLKWITDYLINSHPSQNVLYIQVGDPVEDHKCWDRPETMTSNRPLTQINVSFPGSDVAAETAAAMASSSIVFKSVDKSYSATLLKHAQQLFTFADEHRGLYSHSIPKVQSFYNSSGFGDELLWAASWLCHATGDRKYIEYVSGDMGKDYAQWGSPTWFSWDDKLPGTQVLLSRIGLFGKKGSNTENLQNYRKTAETIICGLLPKSPSATSSRTDGGLIWVSEWHALQQPVGSAFLALLYSDYMLSSRTPELLCNGVKFGPMDLRHFAVSQADYVLGNNPMKMSYLIGYGDTYPKFVHHRGASIPINATTGCKGWKWLKSEDPNPYVAIGALVGGPFFNESYIDARNNSMQGEPSTYNNALLVGLLSGLVTTSSVAKSLH